MNDTGLTEPGPIKFGIGQSVLRLEDPRLLRGKGCFVDDINLEGQTYAFILRSPHAHAVIKSMDCTAARAAPGVVAVYTGEDVAKDGLGTMKIRIPRKRPDGSPMFARAHTGLTQGRVRFVGDPVAMIVAETIMQARDAAELIDIDYEPLASVTDTARASAPDAPRVWDECPDNISNVHQLGNADAVTAAFAKAAHVVKRRYVISRVFAHYMQPRGVLASYDEGDERYTIWADVQYPHRVRNALAENIFKIPEHRIRVIAHDIGGGFGTKGWQYPEHRLMPWAARKLGRPVKWLCDRSEAILADEHARDNVSDAELALDKDGRMLGLRVRTLANIGAYLSSDRNLLSTFANVHTLSGVYDIPAAHVTIHCVMSNTNATAPYRGAGRPESIYVMERLIDDAARELGMDRIDLRRKNVIASAAMPYRNPFGAKYDCGEFGRGMEMALAAASFDSFESRRADSAKRGMLRGIGVANAIESAASPMQQEFAEIRFNPSGSAIVLIGTKHQGQGHETMYKQIVSERLGLDPKEVQFIDGDTDRVSFGMGSNGSRSTVVGGTALWRAADRIIEKGKKIAAHLLEASIKDIEFANGSFTVAGTDLKVALQEVAKAAFLVPRLPAGFEGGLYETATFAPASETYPNGTHVCEVEVDPLTGVVAVLDYVVADDVGIMINPAGVKGQIHGGVAQGLGQALMEQVVYDPDSGQLLSGSFMDYAMPRASDMPMVRVKSNAVPTALNPMGAKGAGEAGTVGAIPAVINAVIDALSPLGVTTIEMPATSGKVWAAIRAARASGAAEQHQGVRA
jgi:aerobic carbon-monoxide dehydrogenase large subunit